MQIFEIIAISFTPVLLILFYIYRRDKYEKEPWKMLLKVLIFGALIVVPVFFIETWLSNYWNNKYNYPSNHIITAAYDSFIVAALTEESFKYFIFILFIWRNRNFNERFDGIVYATYISLGFAAVENLLYVWGSGIGTGILRAFTAIPAHAIFGITMGYFLARAKFRPQYKKLNFILSLSVPILIHGLYDFILMSQHTILLLLFIPFMIFLFIVSFRQMKQLSKRSKFKKKEAI